MCTVDRYKGQKRGFTLNGTRITILNSYVSDIKAVNADSQAINGYNGAGPFTIENNYLEAAGENVHVRRRRSRGRESGAVRHRAPPEPPVQTAGMA